MGPLNPPVFYLTPPSAVVNEAIDSLGESGQIIGSVTDGTVLAEAARRNYSRQLRNLLRTAHWNFARFEAPMQCLGDATGQTPNTVTNVEQPWTYAYAWPTDCVAARWVPSPVCPANGNTTVPLFQSVGPFPAIPLLPGRFLVSSSNLYPIEIGILPWNGLPDLRRTEGLGPTYRRVILTDIPNALLVYTRLVTVIEEWDDLFRQAMVASMAVVLCPLAIKDPKMRMAERDRQVAIARNAIADARVANGNDAGFPQTTQHTPPWVSARNGGWNQDAFGGAGGVGTLGLYLPWEPYSLGGNVF
jgi:hypothetical protein